MANMYVNVSEFCIFSDPIVSQNKGSLAGLETLIKDLGKVRQLVSKLCTKLDFYLFSL